MKYYKNINIETLSNAPQSNKITQTETLQIPGFVNSIIFSLLPFYLFFQNEWSLKKQVTIQCSNITKWKLHFFSLKKWDPGYTLL